MQEKKIKELRQPKSVVEKVLKVLFNLETATSVEIAYHLEIPTSKVSSALSKLYRAIPNLLERDTTKKPYIWRKTSGNASWEEAYRDYLKNDSMPILEEKTVDDPEAKEVPVESFKIVVEITRSKCECKSSKTKVGLSIFYSPNF